MGNSKRDSPNVDGVIHQSDDFDSAFDKKRLTYQDSPVATYSADKRPDLPGFAGDEQEGSGEYDIVEKKHQNLGKIVRSIVAKQLDSGHEVRGTREQNKEIKHLPTVSSRDLRIPSRPDLSSSKHGDYKSKYYSSQRSSREIDGRKKGHESERYRLSVEKNKRSDVFSRLSDRRDTASAPVSMNAGRMGHRESGWENRGYSNRANVANDASRIRQYRPSIASKISRPKFHSQMSSSKCTRTSTKPDVSSDDSLLLWNAVARRQVLASLRKRLAEKEGSIASLTEKIKHYRALNKECKNKLENVRSYLK